MIRLHPATFARRASTQKALVALPARLVRLSLMMACTHLTTTLPVIARIVFAGLSPLTIDLPAIHATSANMHWRVQTLARSRLRELTPSRINATKVTAPLESMRTRVHRRAKTVTLLQQGLPFQATQRRATTFVLLESIPRVEPLSALRAPQESTTPILQV